MSCSSRARVSGAKEFNPPFPFPPGASRGGARSPHAGSTLRASKRRWLASLLPAPPTRGLPPPCESPAEQRYRKEERARTTEHGRMVVKRRNVYTKYLTLPTPRDRNSSFEPQILKKHQTRFDGFDDKILSMYARGMTTREIQGHLQEMYGVEVSPTLISDVTDAVMEEVKAWQSRPLEPLYAILYLDALYVKMRHEGRVENRAVYVALGVDWDGRKDVLGLWSSGNEGAKFWLAVLTELKNRGVKDVLIACVDGLKGFPQAIESIFPETRIQLCMVHLMRASLNYVNWKERKLVAADGCATCTERFGRSLFLLALSLRSDTLG